MIRSMQTISRFIPSVRTASSRGIHAEAKHIHHLFNSDVFQGQGLAPSAALEWNNVTKGLKQASEAAADEFARAMMDWSLQKGVKTYKHFFHPMGLNCRTAGLNKDFLAFDFQAGRPISAFTGGVLTRGETDGSSFPNGGLRATHTAAGYTLWDGITPPFIRGDTLFIPTIFHSWTGDALDEKIPLHRATSALSVQGTRLLRLLGDRHTSGLHTSVGCEQEFFLIDRSLYEQRPDLQNVGRTVLGASPIRGQQMEDHYFGSIPSRVRHFFSDLKDACWRVGIPVETSHNEVAPGQFECAPIFSRSSVAMDMNQMLMAIIEETATQNGLAGLLHEKPFSGVNGSGKHNNWSIDTNEGVNLFKPGKTPAEHTRFMTFLAAIVVGFARNPDLIRLSIAVPGNDHRLGACEAPPGIMSVYTGSHLGEHIESIIKGAPLTGYQGAKVNRDINVEPYGPQALPVEDRNRTSPFPFVGNRFEFRAVGSSQGVGLPQTMLNVIAADGCKYLCDDIEARAAKGVAAEDAISGAVRDALKKYQHIIFNGNGYSEAWQKEAAARGVPNISNCVDAIAGYDAEKNIKLLNELKVLKPHEVHARKDIMLEQYVRTIAMEAKSALTLTHKNVLPAAYRQFALQTAAGVQGISPKELVSEAEKLSQQLDKLSTLDHNAAAKFARDTIAPTMLSLRVAADKIENVAASDLWTLPTYNQMLHSSKW